MSQPIWSLVANLGDVHPVDYGGYFIYRDTTGVYAEEAEVLESPDSDDGEWVVYRFSLERCTFVGGVLSDNRFHPEMPAWFAAPEARRAERPQDTVYLSRVAESCGVEVAALVAQFCSDDVKLRAAAYQAVGEYHGWENFDSYPLKFKSRAEVEARYAPGGVRGS